MIIDSHVHVWVTDPQRYPWSPIGGYVPDSDFPVEKLIEDMASSLVGGAVLVQPTPYGWNNRYLLDAVRSAPDKFRAVCLADPEDPQNTETMRDLVKAEGAKGFRLNWNLKPVSLWQDMASHLSFWKAAEELSVPICIQCTPDYLSLLDTMCQQFPHVRVVIDHFARIKTQDGPNSQDFQQLLLLSKKENVYMKISGFYYCSQQNPPFEDFLPFLRSIHKYFGAKRCVWGSDFPFVHEHWSYQGFLDFLKRNGEYSEDDLDWVLGKTAQGLWW